MMITICDLPLEKMISIELTLVGEGASGLNCNSHENRHAICYVAWLNLLEKQTVIEFP